MSFNRREFIKTGGIVMLGSLATPSILGEVAESYAGKAAGVLFALNHFGVSEGD